MTELGARLATVLVSRYTVGGELGRGGMAIVYRAHDKKLGRDVALKVLAPELAASVGAERFLREIEIAAKLSHPNILALHDCGRAYVPPLPVRERGTGGEGSPHRAERGAGSGVRRGRAR